MGMFNIVDIKKDCPNCGAEVEWQTKGLVLDGTYPIENVLERFELSKRISGEVYTSCDECKCWSEVVIKSGKLGKIKTKNLKKHFELQT